MQAPDWAAGDVLEGRSGFADGKLVNAVLIELRAERRMLVDQVVNDVARRGAQELVRVPAKGIFLHAHQLVAQGLVQVSLPEGRRPPV
ncbi:hypothetical protein HHL19_05970 [Streptomyces sp. R302]|uniref:hypothetical protein n=1 Tax=unclassified Streptomyces TaxID=2593676 RepID=UPI00145CDEE0|nr:MULTISPECIES: hypothetical protein [unclassified Streptomyces]NML53269.1 hypothetical protein [Streptomyces sp. R301]NML78223.1 hypothetical protein [Streptomyces sp. R302]